MHIAFNLVAAILDNANTAYVTRKDLVKRFSSVKLTAKANSSHFLRQESSQEGNPSFRLVSHLGLLWVIDLPSDRKTLTDLKKHIVGEWKEDLDNELSAIQDLMSLFICSSFFPQVMIAVTVGTAADRKVHHAMCHSMFTRSVKSILFVARPGSDGNWADCCRGPNEFELYFAFLFHHHKGEFGERLQDLFTDEEYGMLPGVARDTLHFNIWSIKTICKVVYRVPAALFGALLMPRKDNVVDAMG